VTTSEIAAYEANIEDTKPMRPHWYYTVVVECPVCGRCKTYRERQYTPKPADPKERQHWSQVGCSSCFM
jgi:hypothetical protein